MLNFATVKSYEFARKNYSYNTETGKGGIITNRFLIRYEILANFANCQTKLNLNQKEVRSYDLIIKFINTYYIMFYI